MQYFIYPFHVNEDKTSIVFISFFVRLEEYHTHVRNDIYLTGN